MNTNKALALPKRN